jgi:hypothetical protein
MEGEVYKPLLAQLFSVMSIKYFEQLAMINNPCITPSPVWDRGNGLETQPGIEPSERGNVIPNLPAIARNLAIHGGEEVSQYTILFIVKESIVVVYLGNGFAWDCCGYKDA